MESKYEALPTLPSASFWEDNSKLFKHKNAETVRRQKLLKYFAVSCIILAACGCAFYRIIEQTSHPHNSTQRNVFHLLSTRNSAKIFMWDVFGDNVTLNLQNEITFSADVGNPVSCENTSFELCLKWEDDRNKSHNAELTMRQFLISEGVQCHKLNLFAAWHVGISSCISIAGEHLYGGPITKEYQYWPSEKNEVFNVPRATGQGIFDGIVESYWITSGGKVIYVPRDVPLFISQNNHQLCLHSKITAPYLRDNDTQVDLKFYWCQHENMQKLQRVTTQRFLGVPSGIPDTEMIRYPVWSTWARFKRAINSSVIMDFANQITHYGFNRSQLEIDDRWETCYGEFKFDKEKFPDPKMMIQNLKTKGFRTTLWVHPFVDTLCQTFSEVRSKNYLVKSANGKLDKTVWWDGIAGLIDFTNRNAVSWWNKRLKIVIDKYSIDGFKFDAGETSYMPGSPDVGFLQTPVKLQPNVYTTRYVENGVLLGKNTRISEFRVMYKNQNLPVFLRMTDKDSVWGYDKGLKSLIPTLLSLNIVGYSFILPDMVGGSGYSRKPSKELFIRWLEACTFMPSLQFSYSPWDYDKETVQVAKKFMSLHEEYADEILALAEKKATNGTPINLPIWWIDPSDKTALGIDSEYLLGENLLVAPILEQGATSRDIYLPNGTWQQKIRTGATNIIHGPTWIRGYHVEIDELAYFTRVS